jgi:hypothetical protein
MAKEVKRLEIICLVDPPINLNLSEGVLEASIAAETPGKKGSQNASTTLNAKLADLDQALAAKRITGAEHKRLRARLLAQF